MNKKEALELVEKELPEKRFTHTLGVVQTAIDLAKMYNADSEKAELAAILHDVAKYWSKEVMQKIIEESEISNDLLRYHLSLWHSHVGAEYAKTLGVKDEEVLNAIRYHTTGRIGMSVLEKVVFLADYIEPGRKFPGVDEVRELAERSLNTSVVQALANTMTFLIQQKLVIHPDTVSAYNDLVITREE